MEACEEFSEKMELHADDIEYFYIESKRVTARREEAGAPEQNMGFGT